MITLSTPGLESMLETKEDFLLVNTLPSDKFEQTKLPQAKNIPQDQGDFASNVEQQAGGKEKPVVVYCASQECDSSTKAAEKLDEAGFKNVYDYAGGAKAWQKEHAQTAK